MVDRLNPSILSQDLHIQTFRDHERMDRVGDSHGGIVIYVKENVCYRRRLDLEPRDVECVWTELTLKQKQVLFGLFYRPPNLDMTYYSLLEDSIHLAVDTGTDDIIITGDFNSNMLNSQYPRKINSLCQQFSLY